MATNENEELFGFNNSDLVYGGDGNDTIHGGEPSSNNRSDDTLNGGAGADLLFGQEGNDQFWNEWSRGDRDTIEGGAGHDLVNLSFLECTQPIRFIAGRAHIEAPNAPVLRQIESFGIVRGGKAGDYFQGDKQSNWFSGAGGSDKFKGGGGEDILLGDDGNDQIEASSGDDLVHGGTGNDRLHGGAGADRMAGGAGNDSLLGGSAGNVLLGNEGNDSIRGGNGADTIRGDAGEDRVEAAGHNDIVIGASGKDRLDGGAGNDLLSGGSEADKLIGSAGKDLLAGNSGDDRLSGGSGEDILISAEGKDLVFGDGADDLISGGPSNDTLNGGDGKDTLLSGSGSDRMHGGAGQDVIFTGFSDKTDAGSGHDRVSAVGGMVNLGSGDDVLLYTQPEQTESPLRLDGGAGVDRVEFWLAEAEETTSEASEAEEEPLKSAPLHITLTPQGNLSLTSGGTQFVQGQSVEDLGLVVTGDHHDELQIEDEFGVFVVTGKGRDTLRSGEGDDLISGAEIVEGGGGDDWISVELREVPSNDLLLYGMPILQNELTGILESSLETLTDSAQDLQASIARLRFAGGAIGQTLSDLQEFGVGNKSWNRQQGSEGGAGNSEADVIAWAVPNGYAGYLLTSLGIGGSLSGGGLLGGSLSIGQHPIAILIKIEDAQAERLRTTSLKEVVFYSQSGFAGFTGLPSYVEGSFSTRPEFSHEWSGGEGADTLNGYIEEIRSGGQFGGTTEVTISLRNSLLDGGIGADTMRGGHGADLFVVDNRRDIIIETSGGIYRDVNNTPHGSTGSHINIGSSDIALDEVESYIERFTLPENIEILTLAEGARVGIGNSEENELIGNSLDNRLIGWGGTDLLVGGGGADQLRGGDSSDLYYADGLDTIIEDFFGGLSDTVISTGDMRLAENVEVLRLSEKADSGIGNSSKNAIHGNQDRSNTLLGEGGNDLVRGGNLNDTLTGCSRESLGVQEIDMLVGGGGADQFVVGSSLGSFYLGTSHDAETPFKKLEFGEHAVLMDFEQGTDQLVLAGTPENYTSMVVRSGSRATTFLSYAEGESTDSQDLVAILKGAISDPLENALFV